MRALTLKDTHFRFGFKHPIGRTSDFETQIKDKINQVITIAKDRNADYLILTGDSTDIKTPSNYTLPQVKANIDIFKELKRHFKAIYDIAGNHSLPYSAIEYKKDSFYQLLIDNNFIVDLTKGVDLTYDYLIGIDYTDNQADLLDKIKKIDRQSKSNKYNILIIHEHLLPKGETLPFGKFISYEDITKDLQNVNMIIAGHLHKGYKTQTITNNLNKNITIINQWNLTRLSRDYYAVSGKHIPQVTFIDTNKNIVETIDLRCADFDKAFVANDLKATEQVTKNIKDFAKVCQDAKDFGVENALQLDKIKEFVKNDIDLNVLSDRIQSYITQARIS